jgi:crotonobetainyl-CoA:carnitine CoA-transferase CaiB-like acyl-CoA transferase
MPAPLEDLKILDFTTLLPGPFGMMLLADLGAEIIRVEAPNRLDLVRNMPPLDGDTSGSHRIINRSKSSITLDLKKPSAVEIVKRLVCEYEIVVEQFRPGVMDKLNVGIYYDYYRTAEGGYMSVGSIEPQFFQALCGALCREDLLTADQATLKKEFAAEFSKRTRAEWVELFSTGSMHASSPC